MKTENNEKFNHIILRSIIIVWIIQSVITFIVLATHKSDIENRVLGYYSAPRLAELCLVGLITVSFLALGIASFKSFQKREGFILLLSKKGWKEALFLSSFIIISISQASLVILQALSQHPSSQYFAVYANHLRPVFNFFTLICIEFIIWLIFIHRENLRVLYYEEKKALNFFIVALGGLIYVWYNHVEGEQIPLIPKDATDADWDAVPPNSFYIFGGDDGDNKFEQGLFLFEGWRFVNAISITIKTANNSTLDIYRSSINHNIDGDPSNYDYGMGFIDFGLEEEFDTLRENILNLNAYEPLYQGADNVRASTSIVNEVAVFDFVEPNMNPNYDAMAFTTLQTFVAPPALKEKVDAAVNDLKYGFSRVFWIGN